jgi:hypothetical protein
MYGFTLMLPFSFPSFLFFFFCTWYAYISAKQTDTGIVICEGLSEWRFAHR